MSEGSHVSPHSWDCLLGMCVYKDEITLLLEQPPFTGEGQRPEGDYLPQGLQSPTAVLGLKPRSAPLGGLLVMCGGGQHLVKKV